MRANKPFGVFLALFVFSLQFLSAQEGKIEALPIKSTNDSIIAPLPTIDDLLGVPQDSIKTDSVVQAPGLLLGKIKYSAKDYVRLSQKENKIYLYNEAEVFYQDTELKAGVIVLDYLKNEVYAGRIQDSTGTFTQIPFFKQGDNEVRPDSIRFNFKSQKALIWNSRTEQTAPGGGAGGFNVGGGDALRIIAEKTKKENDSVYFLSEAKITTSNDTIDPDYYIRVRKAKFIPKKRVIGGFSNLYLVDIPTPIALPFAYFPLTTGRTAGLIFPTIGNDPQRGFSIQNGGYYLPISEYVDFSVLVDFFTNGSFGFRTQSIYAKRYKFNGSIDFQFENLVTSQRGFSDFSISRLFNLQIRHTQDAKANPNSRFGASVNLGSSSFFAESANQRNLSLTQNNTLNSSISFSKTFPEYPSVNVSLTATHNQNRNTGIVNLTLPTLQASLERVFPFASQNGAKKGAIQNLNLQYNLRAANSITTTEDDFLTGRMFDDARVTATHTIPINTNFKVAKYLSVTAGGTYTDFQTLRTFDRGINPDNPSSNNLVVTDTINGFARFNNYGVNAGIGTTIYGQANFGDDKKIQALRHVVRPSVGWSYAPSFERFFETVVTEDGSEVQFTRFQGTGSQPSLNRSNTLSFSVQNTLEAKVRDKDSTATEPKKVSLLNNLNFSSSYNLEADSLRLSPVGFNGSTNFFNNTLTLNFNGTLDPFAINNNGNRINQLNIRNGGGLFRLTNAGINLGYSISSDFFSKEKRDDPEEENDSGETYRAASGGRADDFFGSAIDNGSNIDSRRRASRDDPDRQDGAYGTKLPWNLRMQFNSTYNNNNRQRQFTNASLMFSGDVELTPKWQVGFSSGYDFVGQGFSLTQFRFSRELKSFDLRFNWTPFGQFQRWDFFIGIRANLLRDLKYEARSRTVR